MVDVTKNLSVFTGDVDILQLEDEITANTTIATALSTTERPIRYLSATQIVFVFDAALPGAEDTELLVVMAAHAAVDVGRVNQDIIQVCRTTDRTFDTSPDSLSFDVARNAYNTDVYTWSTGTAVTVVFAGLYNVCVNGTAIGTGVESGVYELSIAIDGSIDANAVGQGVTEEDKGTNVSISGVFTLAAGATIDAFAGRIIGTIDQKILAGTCSMTVERVGA